MVPTRKMDAIHHVNWWTPCVFAAFQHRPWPPRRGSTVLSHPIPTYARIFICIGCNKKSMDAYYTYSGSSSPLSRATWDKVWTTVAWLGVEGVNPSNGLTRRLHNTRSLHLDTGLRYEYKTTQVVHLMCWWSMTSVNKTIIIAAIETAIFTPSWVESNKDSIQLFLVLYAIILDFASITACFLMAIAML